MNLFQAALLGIVQGLTEFLPISSTAHLRIVPALCGWEDPGAAFTAVTQIGTLIAVLVYFSSDIQRLAKAFVRSVIPFRPFSEPDSKMAWMIILGTIPIGVCGLLFKESIETSFRSLYVISSSLILLALVMWVAEKVSSFRRGIDGMNLKDTQIIGWAQALALIPGASRSGTTITAGMFIGLTREAAARFSFLLSIPAVFASGVFELISIRETLTFDNTMALVVSTFAAGIVGYAAIAFLLRFLRTHKTFLFIWYRIILGILILILVLSGTIQP